MYPEWLGGILLVWVMVTIVWLSTLTVLFLKLSAFLKRLFPEDAGSFKEKLDQMIGAVASVEQFKQASKGNLQKQSLKRYNPYHDTGGDQSFSFALLDGKGDGVVITSLHSRAGTRVFAKPVVDGKEVDFAFSDEEKAVVKQALTR